MTRLVWAMHRRLADLGIIDRCSRQGSGLLPGQVRCSNLQMSQSTALDHFRVLHKGTHPWLESSLELCVAMKWKPGEEIALVSSCRKPEERPFGQFPRLSLVQRWQIVPKATRLNIGSPKIGTASLRNQSGRSQPRIIQANSAEPSIDGGSSFATAHILAMTVPLYDRKQWKVHIYHPTAAFSLCFSGRIASHTVDLVIGNKGPQTCPLYHKLLRLTKKYK